MFYTESIDIVKNNIENLIIFILYIKINYSARTVLRIILTLSLLSHFLIKILKLNLFNLDLIVFKISEDKIKK